MEKVIDKVFRADMFEDKYFLRIENTIKTFVQDIRVDLEVWKQYNIGDEYNE
jgi:hypothetical protein